MNDTEQDESCSLLCSARPIPARAAPHPQTFAMISFNVRLGRIAASTLALSGT